MENQDPSNMFDWLFLSIYVRNPGRRARKGIREEERTNNTTRIKLIIGIGLRII